MMFIRFFKMLIYGVGFMNRQIKGLFLVLSFAFVVGGNGLLAGDRNKKLANNDSSENLCSFPFKLSVKEILLFIIDKLKQDNLALKAEISSLINGNNYKILNYAKSRLFYYIKNNLKLRLDFTNSKTGPSLYEIEPDDVTLLCYINKIAILLNKLHYAENIVANKFKTFKMKYNKVNPITTICDKSCYNKNTLGYECNNIEEMFYEIMLFVERKSLNSSDSYHDDNKFVVYHDKASMSKAISNCHHMINTMYIEYIANKVIINVLNNCISENVESVTEITKKNIKKIKKRTYIDKSCDNFNWEKKYVNHVIELISKQIDLSVEPFEIENSFIPVVTLTKIKKHLESLKGYLRTKLAGKLFYQK